MCTDLQLRARAHGRQMALRTENNLIKREFLNQWVKRGSKVLDVGCGQGGDIHKWRHLGVDVLVGVDPNPDAIEEARRRSQGRLGVFYVGDVCTVNPKEKFDVICYNFSLQYQSLELLYEVRKRLVEPTGIFLGVVTDSSRLQLAEENGIHVTPITENEIEVFIPNTPYYVNGPVREPILKKEELIRTAEKLGMKLELWEPFSIYAKFVFSLVRHEDSHHPPSRGSRIHPVHESGRPSTHRTQKKVRDSPERTSA